MESNVYTVNGKINRIEWYCKFVLNLKVSNISLIVDLERIHNVSMDFIVYILRTLQIVQKKWQNRPTVEI